jgi:hypothetical protein
MKISSSELSDAIPARGVPCHLINLTTAKAVGLTIQSPFSNIRFWG